MNEDSFMFYPEITDEKFNEKIYLKKEFRDTEIKDKINWNKRLPSKREFVLEPHQIFLKNYISPDTPYNGILVYNQVGTGKCHLKGTQIIMYDGTIKNVEDIEVGDLLMGDNSKPRNVTSLARGKDKMYEIISSRGEKYTVNSEHILCLKSLDSLSNIVEITVKDYLELPIKIKNKLKGYKVEIDFPEKYLEIDPYHFGYSLKEGELINGKLDLDKCGNIPLIYKCNSKDNRLMLLAGIIDRYGLIINNYFILSFNRNNKVFFNDIIYLARSLGFDSFNDILDNIIIKGDISSIPSIKFKEDLFQRSYKTKELLLTDIDIKYVNIDDYYGFTLDGNCRYLLGDFTVTHNTCASIQIAEGFKKTLKNMNKRVLILTNLRENFLNELYNYHKERVKKNPEDMVQCTGKEYELGEESLYLSFQQKRKEIEKLKKSYYEIMGYQRFANYITEITGGWKGDEKNLTEKIKKVISKEFDDRVIIIDEIQNIKTDKGYQLSKSSQIIIQSIVKYSKNIKLILMSGTPMFDRPDEIIFYINLLLQNDGRETIKKSDIFNSKDGTLKPHAEDKLREIFIGYVSYVRGEKPYIFPFRIYPAEAAIPKVEYYMSGEKIDQAKQIRYTKVILCDMKKIQSNTYSYYFEKKIKEGKIKKNIDNKDIYEEDENIDSDEVDEKKIGGILSEFIAISNITYPIANNNNIGSFNKYSINADYDNGLGGYYKSVKISGSRKKIQYKYQSHAIFDKDTVNEAPFADEKHLYKYSIKFSKILETIRKSKGLILIFSQFIELGVLPLALMLEQNGFDRECIEGEDALLDYDANKLKGGGKKRQICYLCGKSAKHIDHQDEKSDNYHMYKRAKYILCFGRPKDVVKIEKDQALKKFNSDKNKYGEEIKIFIGTKVVSEGLDFKRLRQVHIVEPWYNLSRHEQIIGRAIRNQSHRDLLPEENNVEVYEYAAVLDKSNRESVDLKIYRMAENKDIIIKNITRIMKESAVDCVFFKNTNIIADTNKKEKQITSSGNVINISINDKPFSSMCDYKQNCNYKCNWMPNPRLKYPINTDTYNIRFSKNDIEIIKKNIKNMFRENIVYNLDKIESNILNKDKNIDKLFIYKALEDITNNKNETIYDKFGRKGYIIYRGDYYIFQPFDLQRDELPLLYRMYPTNEKTEHVDLENIQLDYIEDEPNNRVKEENIDENIIFNKIIENIKDTYEDHNKMMYLNKQKYIYSVIGSVVDKLNRKKSELFYKNLLINYLKKDENNYINDIAEYLNYSHRLINYYGDIIYDKSKIKDNFFVGYIINKEYFIIDSVEKTKDIKSIKINKLNFINCSKETIAQIKFYRGFNKKEKIDKDYNVIYGIIEHNVKKDIKIFKIIDKSVEEVVLTKEKKESKRSIITGRTCSTFKYHNLIEMREKLGLYKIESKQKIDFVCEDIEIYLRLKNLLKSDNKVWFEEVEE